MPYTIKIGVIIFHILSHDVGIQFHPYFGFILNAQDSNCDGFDVVIILEEFLADRWILLYKKREENSEPFARYILFHLSSEQNFV